MRREAKIEKSPAICGPQTTSAAGDRLGGNQIDSCARLGGNADSLSEHVAKQVRSYVGSPHAADPDQGCVYPTLGAKITRAWLEVKTGVERSLKRRQHIWAERLGDVDGSWALIYQRVGADLLARVVENDRNGAEILAASCRLLDKALRTPHASLRLVTFHLPSLLQVACAAP